MLSSEPGSASPATRILLIDADPGMAPVLHMLGREHGWCIHAATDGAQGLQLAQTIDCDLIVMDLHLPVMTGLDVCRRLRSSAVNVPIIIVSKSSDPIDVVVALEVGADDYVVKPFEYREIGARIAAHLRRQRQGLPQVKPGRLRFPGISIDFGRHEVVRDGMGEVQLTPTEFALLGLLVTQAGRVVSRHDMKDAIWHDADIDLRSVDAHIYRLRRKLEPGRVPVYIHATPGIGYTFDYRPLAGESALAQPA